MRTMNCDLGEDRLLAREDGFTLIELLVGMAVSLVVFTATLTVMSVAFNQQSQTDRRAQAIQLGSVMAERMAREIRQASQATIETGAGAPVSTGGRLDLLAPVAATPGAAKTTMHVVYDCTAADQCTRAQGPVGGTLGTATLVIAQVSNGSGVFRGTPGATNPQFISLTLDQSLGAPFSNPVEFQDGVALRDLTP